MTINYNAKYVQNMLKYIQNRIMATKTKTINDTKKT